MYRKQKKRNLQMSLLLLLVTAAALSVYAEPEPGDVFREYPWYCKIYNEGQQCDAGDAVRVGGQGNKQYSQIYSFARGVNLTHAVRAELYIEKVLSHSGTHSLSVEVNGNEWISVPDPEGLPEESSAYYHLVYPVIEVPLSFLAEADNTIRFRVAPDQDFNWPQHLINGLVLWVYYDSSEVDYPTGTIAAPVSGSTAGMTVDIRAEVRGNGNPVEQVDFIGLYDGVNWEGEGAYRRWHYHFYHGNIIHHLGTAQGAPFEITWNTSWVPDQQEPMEFCARIIAADGMIYMTEPAKGLELKRPGYSVELCRPYDVPRYWVTRQGEYEEHFDVKGDLNKADSARLMFVSWSPGYLNGLFINNENIIENEGPRYETYFHHIPVTDLPVFKEGQNALSTAKTPLYDGEMVHGCEIMYPGIQPLIRYTGLPVSAKEGIKEEKSAMTVRADGKGALVLSSTHTGPGHLLLVSPDGSRILDTEINRQTVIPLRRERCGPGVYIMRFTAGIFAESRVLTVLP